MAATYYWRGGAAAVSQVTTATVGSTTVGHTFFLKAGGITLGSYTAGGAESTTTIATALTASFNASTHPYATGITATSNAAVVTLTADTAGVPFVITSPHGGTGTLTIATPTVNAGPNDYSTLANWWDATNNAVPTALPGAVTNDKIIFEDGSANVCWGLDQSGTVQTIAELRIQQSYTGKIGLNYAAFATSADGETVNASYQEYREPYLKIKVAAASANGEGVVIGRHDGPGSPTGSPRLCIDCGTTAATITIIKTAQASSESGRPTVRLKANSTTTVVTVYSANGGVGIATEKPGETTTIGKLSIADTTSGSRIFTGPGVTFGGSGIYETRGGLNLIQSAASIPDVRIYGGTTTLDGDFTITSLTVYSGGTCYCQNIKTAGNAITAAELWGGTLDGSLSTRARTWAAVSIHRGATLRASDAVTITTLSSPSSVENGTYTLLAS